MKKITIGSDPKCDIVIPNELTAINSTHAYIERDKDNKFYITDISVSGIVLNNQWIPRNQPQKIDENDNIYLGDSFKLSWDDIQAAFAIYDHPKKEVKAPIPKTGKKKTVKTKIIDNEKTIVATEDKPEYNEYQPETNTEVHTFSQKKPLSEKNIPNYFTWSILVTIFCCLPIGIAAIVNSSKVNTLISQGRYKEAQAASKKTKRFCWWALILGIIFGGFYIAVQTLNY